MFQRFYSLASNTFIETVRQPLYSVILAATALMMIFNVGLAAFTLEDDDKLLLDLGLNTLLLGGLFLSAFSAAGVLSREIENKTVLTVISKPISRPLLIAGKFVGLLAALIFAFYLSFLAFVLAVRHGVLENSSDPWDAPVLVFGFGAVFAAILIAAFRNYFYGKPFVPSALSGAGILLTAAVLLVGVFDKRWEVIPFGSKLVGGQMIIAAYFVFLIVMITAAAALAASTRFGQLMTLLICTAVLAVGVISDYAFGQYEAKSRAAMAAYRLLPNLGPFWIVEGLTANSEQTTATGTYVLLVTAYALLMTFALLNLAVVAFQRREVG